MQFLAKSNSNIYKHSLSIKISTNVILGWLPANQTSTRDNQTNKRQRNNIKQRNTTTTLPTTPTKHRTSGMFPLYDALPEFVMSLLSCFKIYIVSSRCLCNDFALLYTLLCEHAVPAVCCTRYVCISRLMQT